jgi:TolA-binding protein
MGLFGFGKKGKDVVDLGERFRKQKEKEEQMASSKSASESSSPGPIAFFDSSSDSSGGDPEVIDLSNSFDERRKRLAKRILEMTNKLEDLSNQIYHLQQRIEILEKKSNVRI